MVRLFWTNSFNKNNELSWIFGNQGEVYVLNDGGEVDLDLGNYERYLNVTLSRDNNITTGKIYREVIEKEVRYFDIDILISLSKSLFFFREKENISERQYRCVYFYSYPARKKFFPVEPESQLAKTTFRRLFPI